MDELARGIIQPPSEEPSAARSPQDPPPAERLGLDELTPVLRRDWRRHFHARLGFEEVGRTRAFLRT